MFNIIDTNCPVCETMKRVLVKTHTDTLLVQNTRSEYWGYQPLEYEELIEGFCPACGTKFVIGYTADAFKYI